MTVTNKAIGEKINLATVLNTKLELPILQSEMGLNALATAIGEAIRWDEFSVKHNNDGTFKAGIINQADISLASSATATTQPIRWDEFNTRHNNDGTLKLVANMYKKASASNPSATAATYGTAVSLTPLAGYSTLVPQAMDVVFGGTFGAETVTARVTVTYSDTTTASVTKTATATGTTPFTNADLMALLKDGVYITQIDVDSMSNIASTTATVTFNHYGLYV